MFWKKKEDPEERLTSEEEQEIEEVVIPERYTPDEEPGQPETSLLSVVIPVYNAEENLPNCLASIRQQNYQNWEVILVDDGSKDGSGRICDEAAAADPRFRVIHKENAGVSDARNDGIEAAKGRYLMFIDADDLVVPYYFKHMVRAAERYSPDLLICGFDRFRESWRQRYKLTNFHIAMFRDIKQYLMLYTVPKTNMYGVSVWAKLYRMDMINEHHLRFDPSISYEEDCNFIADLLKHVKTVAAMGASMYRYRQQEESLSKGYRKDTFRFLVNGYNRRCGLLKDNDLSQFLPKLKNIFFTVIKTTCKKILNADLPQEEKIEEYRKLMEFPEVQDAVTFERKSKSGFTNRICTAIKEKDPKKLDRVMRSWQTKDKAFAFLYKIKRGVKKVLKKIKRLVKR